MEKLKVGDVLKMHCYKHNGTIHRTWNEAVVLDIIDDILICGNYKTLVTEKNGKTHNTKELAIIFFYQKRWFNVFAQFKKRGLYYKCNIASPYLIDEDIIKFIDYDLDLKVYPDSYFKVLDKNEYKYHKKIMRYSEELDKILKSELNELIKMKEQEMGPFNKEVVYKYQKKYLKMLEERKKTSKLM